MGVVEGVVASNARRAPTQLAFVQQPSGRTMTFAELDQAAMALTNTLVAAGGRPGDRIVLGLPSVLEHLVAYVAGSRLGATVVPLHHDAPTWEIHRVVDDAQARVLIASEEFAARVDRGDVGVVLLDAGAFRLGTPARDGAALPVGAAESVLAYTSGTTGEPKAVRITEANLAHLFPHQCLGHRVPMFGRSLVAMPLSFVAACLDMVLAHLYMGSTVIFHERFDAGWVLDSLDAWQPNFAWFATPMLQDLHDELGGEVLDAPYLTTVHHGASALPDKLGRWLFASVGDRLVEGYGMTENSGGLVTCTTYSDYGLTPEGADARLGSVGRAMVGTELRLVDEGGEPMPPGADGEGEIWIRGPGVSPGYWGRNESLADERGWYHTGDLARRDADGYVFLAGRIRDTIQTGGATVHASEVEACIRELAGVRDVAAFGLPHVRWGEAVAVAVITAPGAALSVDDVQQHCARRLAGFKKPRAVVFVDDLPRTASGKVRKDSLREQVGEFSIIGDTDVKFG